jgi:hypothetical protein
LAKKKKIKESEGMRYLRKSLPRGLLSWHGSVEVFLLFMLLRDRRSGC